jgi:hypothetical protein
LIIVKQYEILIVICVITPYSLVGATNIFEERSASSFGVDVNQIWKVADFIKEVGRN